jgi:serine/threonine-protein kinase
VSEQSDKKTRLATPLPPQAQQVAPLAANVPAAGMGHHQAPPDPLVGKTLVGRYFVEKKLGEGGMGAVYKAKHITLEKEVALKVLHAEFSRKGDLVERFLQEAKAASRIRHENVIDISDFGTTPDGSVFFAMEFLEGRDLHDVLARAKLQGQVIPWERSRKIFLQVCAALSAAHAKGIIHRDLKPENIYLVEWLGHEDFVKLLDFGIAKVTEVTEEGGQERKLTKTGMLFGTPEYMSPEQARGEKVDPRVDVYAMGCILYQMITGRVPFEADNFMSILSKHLTEEAPRVTPEELGRVGAPPELAEIITGALAKAREDRYSSIDELASAIRALTEGGEVQLPAGGQTSSGRTRTKWTGSVTLRDDEPQAAKGGGKGGIIALVAVLALAAVGGGVYALTRGGGGDDADESASTKPGGDVAGTGDDTAAIPRMITLSLDSVPQGASVIDQNTNEKLGTTPFTQDVPGSREPRRFRFKLAGHHDRLLELIPAENIDYTVRLKVAAKGSAAVEPDVEVMPQKKMRKHRRATSKDTRPKVDEPKASVKTDEPKAKTTVKADKPKASVKTDEPKAKTTVKADKPKATVKKPKAKADKPKPKAKADKPKAKTTTPGDVKLKNPFGKKKTE